MTFKEILNIPNSRRVSVFRALAALDHVRASAASKASVLKETLSHDADNERLRTNNELMIRWFEDIADSADRQINDINEQSA